MQNNFITEFRGQRGFTLVETIMVIIFLGVAFIAVLQVMSSSVSHSVDTELLTRATALAEEKMEKIVGDKNGRGYAYLVNSNYPTEANAGGNHGFTRSVSIVEYSTYKSIQVSVAHTGIQPVRLVSFVTNY